MSAGAELKHMHPLISAQKCKHLNSPDTDDRKKHREEVTIHHRNLYTHAQSNVKRKQVQCYGMVPGESADLIIYSVVDTPKGLCAREGSIYTFTDACFN